MSIDTFIKENPRFAKREPKVAIDTEQDKLEEFDNMGNDNHQLNYQYRGKGYVLSDKKN